MNSADCVRNYKLLVHVERAFRSLKTIDLKIRPIHHRLTDRVRASPWSLRETERDLFDLVAKHCGPGEGILAGPANSGRREMIELLITPQLPIYPKLANDVFLLLLDGRTWAWTEMRARREPGCPVCGPVR